MFVRLVGWLVWFSLVFVYKIGKIIACLCPHEKDIRNYQCRGEKEESCSSDIAEQATLGGKQAAQPQHPERSAVGAAQVRDSWWWYHLLRGLDAQKQKVKGI